MHLLIILLQSIPTDIGERILEINPWNAGGYGLALGLAITFAVVFYKRWIKADEYNQMRDSKVLEFNTETLKLMVKIEQRLNDQVGQGENIKDLRTSVAQLTSRAEEILGVLRNNQH